MNTYSLLETQNATPRPLLKWAGGKTQLLPEILPKIPRQFNQYIEPFVGGGALFFALRPNKAIIADSNPEIINLYQVVATDLEALIHELKEYQNSETFFYKLRCLSFSALPNVKAAARTLFLNKTCFNGLYRVNKQGHFNSPFGRYNNPKIIDKPALYAASALLKNARILCRDYKQVLKEFARKGDFVFLDPPYLPVSKFADFKRYTKEQFYEEDHCELASEVRRLKELGCYIVMTNANHPLVHDLYDEFERQVFQTRRHISCNGGSRHGEDLIITIPPKARFHPNLSLPEVPVQVLKYPATRFMGSKNKLLANILGITSQFSFDTAIDVFSGSGIVGYMFKSLGKKVISNDYMAMAATFSQAMIENSRERLLPMDIEKLLISPKSVNNFVQSTFAGLYFNDSDNKFIDILRANIKKIPNPYKRAIAMSGLIRACLKKRPRGIFTYVGNRYDDGRKDLQLSLRDHFLEAIAVINNAVFDNKKNNLSRHGDAMSLKSCANSLAYIDPPYFSPFSDNEYVRRYHFVEGLARDWKGVEIQESTLTKKFKSYPTPFSSRKGAADAFHRLFSKFSRSIIVASYSSNSQPSMDEMTAILSKYKQHVEVIPVEHRYSFGNQNKNIGANKNSVSEYLFVGY